MSIPSFRFSPKTASLLHRFGWSPGRRVDISASRKSLESSGYIVHPEAIRTLEEFEGLELQDPAGRLMRIEGKSSAVIFEHDELPYLRALHPEPLCPAGLLAGMVYLISQDGRWIALHEGWTVMHVFANANDAFLFALSDELPPFSRRMLRNEEIPPGYY